MDVSRIQLKKKYTAQERIIVYASTLFQSPDPDSVDVAL
jgi:hypothetical protein